MSMMQHVFQTIRYFVLVALVWTAFPAAGWAQNAPAGGSIDPSGIIHLVGIFEQANKACVGLSVVDLRTDETVAVLHGGEGLIPASNQKILTSAFALQRLGAQGTFATSVYAAGDDVIVAGQFDPLLGDPNLAKERGQSIYAELDRWVGAIKQAFGDAIPGGLVLACRTDPTTFRPPSWERRHHDRWFGAPVADLSFHDNCFDVTFVADAGVIRPVVTPASRFLRVLNELQYQPKGRHLWRLRESPDSATLTLTGQIAGPAADPLSVPMLDPRITLGRVLADRVLAAGVRVGGKLRILSAGQVSLEQARLLIRSESTLADVLKRANKRSLNLAAECMLLRAGDGTWAGSGKLMHDVLVERYQLDSQTLVVQDGSGLSRGNRISPDDMTRLLVALSRGDGAEMFLASLPRNGVDGSLRRRLRQEAYRGRIAAKTGTLAGVRTLSGYVLDAQGKPVVAFAILANDLGGNAQGRANQLQDQICVELIQAVDSR